MRFAPWISPDDSPALINILYMSVTDDPCQITNKIYDKKHGYKQPDKNKDKRGICTEYCKVHINGKECKTGDGKDNKDCYNYIEENGLMGVEQ
jgi:hypothetical protein